MRVRFTSGSPFIGSPLTVIKLELFSGFAATTQPSADTIFSEIQTRGAPRNSHILERWAHNIRQIPVNSPALPAEIEKNQTPLILRDTAHSPPSNFESEGLLGVWFVFETECSVEKARLFGELKGASDRGSHAQLIVIPTVDLCSLIDRVLASGLPVEEQCEGTVVLR